jgi:hypothetical protein
MDDIKKPKWEKELPGIASSGGYSPKTPMPPDEYIGVGMTAHATHKSDRIIIKITKVENKVDAEGTIKQIIPKIKGRPQTDLLIGDRVFINRWDMDDLPH